MGAPMTKINNTRGAFLVVASMAGFTAEDIFIKLLSGQFPLGQLIFSLGVLSFVVFGAQIIYERQNLLQKVYWQPKIIFRMFFEGLSCMSFSYALSQIDISTVAAVFQTTPLVTTLFAAVFLKEAVGWRRWSAISIGFIGVLLIVRPGFEGFEPITIFVIISVVSVAIRDLLTRSLPEGIPSSVISFQALSTFIPCGLILLYLQQETMSALNAFQISATILAGLCGILGYFALVLALRTAETGAIMPFRYMRLVFSMIGGMIVFSEQPDLPTLIGASLILLAGIYTFFRERKLQKQQA